MRPRSHPTPFEDTVARPGSVPHLLDEPERARDGGVVERDRLRALPERAEADRQVADLLGEHEL
ncbi:MAG: hypothetical protein ACK559_36335, partial [bacterium]